MMIFENRQQAGRLLGDQLKISTDQDPIIFALPRGGVPIGHEIANRLGAPLEVLVVRKIGAPFNPEYGIGAIVEGGYYWIDSDAARAVGATSSEIQRIARQEFTEVNRRVEQYRGGRLLPSLHGRTAIVVDDGLATGVTARVACHYLKDKGAEKVILAVPVCSPQTTDKLRTEIDEVLCLLEPENFYAVGQFYQNFEQVSDKEVTRLLSQTPSLAKNSIYTDVTVQEDGLSLPGLLSITPHSMGCVIFAHGSGSSRLSPRNQQVATALVNAGFGTLLFDLLTEEESRNRSNVFDIPLLASRLVAATKWLRRQDFGKDISLGFFGASTGGAAALWAAADLGTEISAIVSRGGRPDLAIPRLAHVSAPTLMIVGGNDDPVIDMNQEALNYLTNGNLVIISGATHLFEEPGTLEQVTQEAILWFSKYLIAADTSRKVA